MIFLRVCVYCINRICIKKIYHATCHADAMKSGNLIDSDSEMRDVNNSNKRKMEDSIGQVKCIFLKSRELYKLNKTHRRQKYHVWLKYIK